MTDGGNILRRLTLHEVEFVIVGGFAAVAHGVTLMTQDIDVCCLFSVENLFRLQAALDGLHPVHRLTPERVPLHLTKESCAGLKNLYLDTDWGVLDCLGKVAGVGDYGKVLAGSQKLELEFGTCRVLTLDTLIAAKRAMDRPRDREALLQLEAIRERSESFGELENPD